MNYHESTLPRCDESMWPGFHYTDGPPPFATKRAHKPPGWPHDRPCWCGAREHSKAVAPSALRLRHRLRRLLKASV